MAKEVVLPELASGDRYRIVFRLPGFKPRKTGALGGTIPKIKFRNKCICCDKPTGNTVEIDPTIDGNRVLKSPMYARVCAKCEPHALDNDWRSRTSTYVGAVGGGIAILSFMGMMKTEPGTMAPVIGFFVGLAIVVAAIILYASKKRNREDGSTHHSSTKIYTIRDKELIVETSNERVASELIEDFPDLLSHVNTSAQKIDQVFEDLFKDDSRPLFDNPEAVASTEKLDYTEIIKWFGSTIDDSEFRQFLQTHLPDVAESDSNYIVSDLTRVQIGFSDPVPTGDIIKDMTSTTGKVFSHLNIYPESEITIGKLPADVKLTDNRKRIILKAGEPLDSLQTDNHPVYKHAKILDVYEFEDVRMTIDYDGRDNSIMFIQLKDKELHAKEKAARQGF